jgi:hypothetical protein
MFKRGLIQTAVTKDNTFKIILEGIPVRDSFYFVSKILYSNSSELSSCMLLDNQYKKIRELSLDFNFTDQEIYDLYCELQLKN